MFKASLQEAPLHHGVSRLGPPKTSCTGRIFGAHPAFNASPPDHFWCVRLHRLRKKAWVFSVNYFGRASVN